jgi:hypothetical protein
LWQYGNIAADIVKSSLRAPLVAHHAPWGQRNHCGERRAPDGCGRAAGIGGAFQKMDRSFENWNAAPFHQVRSLLNPRMPVTLCVSDVLFSLRETPILT